MLVRIVLMTLHTNSRVHCSLVCGSAASCHLQLLERQVRSVQRLWSDLILAPLDHRRIVDGLCMLYKVYYNSIHCLYGELHFLLIVWHTRAAVEAHRFELDVPETQPPNATFPDWLRSCMEWYTWCCVWVWFVWWVKGSRQQLVAVLSWFSLFCGVGACNAIIYKIFVFSHFFLHCLF